MLADSRAFLEMEVPKLAALSKQGETWMTIYADKQKEGKKPASSFGFRLKLSLA